MKTTGPGLVITRSPQMMALLDRLRTVAESEGTVLLLGETGVGKELLAEQIHRLSPRREGPLVKISLSAMPHDLLESELFGHERGAFTTAVSTRKGLFELANGGSIFLDDVDDVPAPTQSKLLRVLESQEVMKVGGKAPVPVDARVISASKVDLKQLVDLGHFRADLYYRLNVVPLRIPALRERREDVLPLVGHFLKRFARGRDIAVSPEAEKALQAYGWPGNVRELRNVTQRLALFAGAAIQPADLPPEILDGHPPRALARACLRCMSEEGLSFSQAVACVEVTLLRHALRDAGGNRSRAARTLGLSLSTLRDKLRKHGLDDEPGAVASDGSSR